MESLLACMAGRFGGVDGLCREMANSLRTATPTAALRGYLTIFHMAEVVEASRQRSDVCLLTDEELQAELEREVCRLLERQEGF